MVHRENPWSDLAPGKSTSSRIEASDDNLAFFAEDAGGGVAVSASRLRLLETVKWGEGSADGGALILIEPIASGEWCDLLDCFSFGVACFLNLCC